MAITRPPFYVLIDKSASNIDPNYGENALNFTGFQPKQVVPSKIHNTLWLGSGLWQAYMDYGILRTDEAIDTTTDQRWSTTKLAYNIGSSVKIGGAGPTSTGVYYVQGCRVTVDEILLVPAGADPLLVPTVATPGAVWVYVDVGVISSPNQPLAIVRVDPVAAGDPATPLAGELALVRVDVDAAGLVSGNTYPGSEPAEEIRFGLRQQVWTGPTRFEETAVFNDPLLALSVQGSAFINGGTAQTAIFGINDNAVLHTVNWTNISGPTISSSAAGAGDGATFDNSGAGAALAIKKSAAGVGLLVDNTVGGGTGISVISPTTGISAVSNGGTAVRGESNVIGDAIVGVSNGSGDAVSGTGGPSPVSSGGIFSSTDTGAVALAAFTAAGATSSAVAVRGTANADSTAVSGIAVNGYGVVAQSDTTLPTRAAARLVPQDNDPSTPLAGDMHFGSNRGTGKLRVYALTHESVHSSPKGWVKNFGVPAAGGPIAGGSGNLSLAQISPEETGDVLVVGTGSLTWSTDTGACTVALVDVTSAVTVASQLERSMDTDGAGSRTRSFSITGVRTLPNTSTRTFAVVITTLAGTIVYDNVVTVSEGVQ